MIRQRIKIIFLTGIAMGFAIGYCQAQESTTPTSPVIRVGKAGGVLRAGKPYRAIGINYFSAFSRTLENPNDTSYREGFDVIVQHKIPFIRFMACPFYPKDWDLYKKDKEAYFARLDGVIKAAEERNLGLIPSLFWWSQCVPDLVGEPGNQWGNPESKTIAFMRQYIKDVVGRYAKSPAIWGWELGNEYSLSADLNDPQNRPPVVVAFGTPEKRTDADDLSHDQIATAAREFAKAVRTVDPDHLITTGHSLPRQSAEHLRNAHTWEHDTHDDLVKNLIDSTPDPNNLISVHVYPFDIKDRFPEKTTTYNEILSLCMKAAAQSGKALFVGEFGSPDTEKEGGPEEARKQCLAQIAAIEAANVPLSAIWVFDLPQQESFINISTTNHRAYLLEEIMKANERMNGGKIQ